MLRRSLVVALLLLALPATLLVACSSSKKPSAEATAISQLAVAQATVGAVPTVLAAKSPTTVPGNTCPQGCTTAPVGCTIKGDIAASGDKTYYLTTSNGYAAAVIDPSKGERWFCTEPEATTNGWRKAAN